MTKLAVLVFSLAFRLMGPGFCFGMYYLMWQHTWVFLTVISKVLRRRLGMYFGMTWTTIGVVITFNVVFNHMLAMIIKPGGPTDLAVSRISRLFLFCSEQ